jgi:hypothetical protein
MTDDTKKRGRKPKGSKLVNKVLNAPEVSIAPVNVILHLKCSMHDLEEYLAEKNRSWTDPLTYNPAVPPEIVSYEDASSFARYEPEEAPLQQQQQQQQQVTTTSEPSSSLVELTQKLKKLKVAMYKNSDSGKKAACFWCTCEYDNPSCCIPRNEQDGVIHGYGSFCRPECAAAFLMKENIDDSTKFERYHQLNNLYGRAYNFKTNIKPAPNPYYLLDKYLGTLTIQEFRQLMNSDHILTVLDKPMTRMLPELHEETDDFVTNIYGMNKITPTVASGVFKVKRQSEKPQGPSKASILRGKFGMTQ